jgi:hypothetical protein
MVDVLNCNQYGVRETSIPDHLDSVSEMAGCHHWMDKEVSSLIVQLMEQNQFSKNFGRKVMSELCRWNTSKERIPSWIQIQNKLSYHHWTVFNFNNEVAPLQDKAWSSVFNGEEAAEQPFAFLYDVDNSNRLALTDVYIVLFLSVAVHCFLTFYSAL